MTYRFKPAETAEEFEQIARLNHAVFAQELGQHTPAESGVLVDKFHDKNRYTIALAGDRVVGMIAFHDHPPFSVAQKLANPSVLDSLGKIAEIRLLAIAPNHRGGTLIQGLFWAMYEAVGAHDAFVISGRKEEERMYRLLGFTPLGPPVQSGDAWFVPMGVTIDQLRPRAERWRRRAE